MTADHTSATWTSRWSIPTRPATRSPCSTVRTLNSATSPEPSSTQASGRLDPDLDEQLEPIGNRILILHSVRLVPEWRGFGLGALLAGTAIRKLSGGARAAVCYPAPLNELTEAGPDDHGDADWDKAVAALQKVWARLGFEHFRDGVHVLDLSLVTLDEKLGQLRKNAERYRTVQG